LEELHDLAPAGRAYTGEIAALIDLEAARAYLQAGESTAARTASERAASRDPTLELAAESIEGGADPTTLRTYEPDLSALAAQLNADAYTTELFLVTCWLAATRLLSWTNPSALELALLLIIGKKADEQDPTREQKRWGRRCLVNFLAQVEGDGATYLENVVETVRQCARRWNVVLPPQSPLAGAADSAAGTDHLPISSNAPSPQKLHFDWPLFAVKATPLELLARVRELDSFGSDDAPGAHTRFVNAFGYRLVALIEVEGAVLLSRPEDELRTGDFPFGESSPFDWWVEPEEVISNCGQLSPATRGPIVRFTILNDPVGIGPLFALSPSWAA
jgi:hypothetical protein